MKHVHVIVRGIVQGVGYRAWTQREAQTLGLSGWVRNCHDGSVEALLQGPDDAIEMLLASMAQGPRHARVTAIECHEANETIVSSQFVVRETE